MEIRDSLDIISKYLLVMELRFEAIVYSKFGDEDSNAGHIKCSRGPQVPTPALDRILIFYSFSKLTAVVAKTYAHIYAREQTLAIKIIVLGE